ncbi:MAG: response regulator [Proteobacteria bacterium]|nr:response regulator [Pseudomonadota bacterium]
MTGEQDPVAAGTRAENRRTILVVEDEILIRSAVALHLRDAGHAVIEAGNADEALRALTADRSVVLVFSDVNMPGTMDGLALARAIRRDRPGLKVVLASGAGWKNGTEIVDVPRLTKPYSFVELTALIERMLAQQD